MCTSTLLFDRSILARKLRRPKGTLRFVNGVCRRKYKKPDIAPPNRGWEQPTNRGPKSTNRGEPGTSPICVYGPTLTPLTSYPPPSQLRNYRYVYIGMNSQINCIKIDHGQFPYYYFYYSSSW